MRDLSHHGGVYGAINLLMGDGNKSTSLCYFVIHFLCSNSSRGWKQKFLIHLKFESLMFRTELKTWKLKKDFYIKKKRFV